MNKNKIISLKNVYSYFVGGQNKTISGAGVRNVNYSLSGVARPCSIDGDYEHGQIYVQAFEQANDTHSFHLLMWHGGGMTGALWESTASGDPGWLNYFLTQGYSIHVSDAVERGRSGFDPAALSKGEPLFRSKQEAWNLFRIGPPDGYSSIPERRQPFANSQFPSQSFDAYCRSFVARFETGNEQTVAAYKRLVEMRPHSVVIAHSQGGGFALQTVSQAPRNVRAVIAIEPSGAPKLTNEVDYDSLCKIPHLIVWGDGIENHEIWSKYRASVDEYVAAIKTRGGQVDVISLPEIGIKGNSHCPMSDSNSMQVAKIVANWLKTNI